MDFLFAGPNLVFSVALALLSLLVLLELGMGGGLTEFLDTLIPDIDADAGSAGSDSMPSKLLSWVRAGKVPTLMLLAIFLGVFGAGGLLLQWLSSLYGPGLLPALLAAPLMLVLAMPLVRIFAGLLGDLLPRDETQVLSQEALVGRTAVIVIGSARRNAPAQAKLRDEFGTSHYVMVEPLHDQDVLEQGQQVRLMVREGGRYRAVRAGLPALENEQ
jgi:hypothetical protein